MSEQPVPPLLVEIAEKTDKANEEPVCRFCGRRHKSYDW